MVRAHRLSPTFPVSVRGSAAYDNFKLGRQFADLGILERLEIDKDEFPVERIADAAQHHVAFVLCVAADEDLGGEQFSVALLHLDVNVRCAPGVRDRLDGPEAVLAFRAARRVRNGSIGFIGQSPCEFNRPARIRWPFSANVGELLET